MGLHTNGSENWGAGWINWYYFTQNIDFIKKWIDI